MTGYRVGTTPSADLVLDTYVTVGSSLVKILCGARIETGTWQITVNDESRTIPAIVANEGNGLLLCERLRIPELLRPKVIQDLARP